MRRIYLDHASTTPVFKKVARTISEHLLQNFGNAGSIHTEGVHARSVVRDSRQKIARILHTTPEEIIFTSGATEANNLAIFGVVKLLLNYKKSHNEKLHVITSVIEHHSVIEPIKQLERDGFVEVTWVPVSETGIVNPKDVRGALRTETVLASIMYANNEIGTVQSIKEISRIVRAWRREKKGTYPLMHSDAAQAPGLLPITMDSLGVDMASFTAQKFYGPRGIGFLYKKSSLGGETAKLVEPQILGGDQEFGIRAGTENVPYIAGMALALELAEKDREKEVIRLTELRDYFIEKVENEIPEAHLNGDREKRLSGNANFSFDGVEGEQMVIELDARGVAVGTGSACTAESAGPSHVIQSLKSSTPKLKGSEERARDSVRFSMGKNTQKRDLDYVVKCMRAIIKKQANI